MAYKLFKIRMMIGAITLFVFTSCTASMSNLKASKDSTRFAQITASSEQEKIISFGKKYLGRPYRSGSKGSKSFDCSGFTSFVYGNFGVKLAPSSYLQDEQVPNIKKRKDLLPGDLVFFEGRSHNGRVGHVGIVTEIGDNGNFKFIHAACGKGVTVSNSREDYYASRYLRGGRVLNTPMYAQRDKKKEQKEQPSVETAVAQKSDNPNVNSTILASENDEPKLPSKANAYQTSEKSKAIVNVDLEKKEQIVLVRNADNNIETYNSTEADKHAHGDKMYVRDNLKATRDNETATNSEELDPSLK